MGAIVVNGVDEGQRLAQFLILREAQRWLALADCLAILGRLLLATLSLLAGGVRASREASIACQLSDTGRQRITLLPLDRALNQQYLIAGLCHASVHIHFSSKSLLLFILLLVLLLILIAYYVLVAIAVFRAFHLTARYSVLVSSYCYGCVLSVSRCVQYHEFSYFDTFK